MRFLYHIAIMSVKKISMSGMGAAFIAICSFITVPTAVPFTLQTLAVFLTVGLLGGGLGTTSVVIYILLGAVGLPVFSGFRGGVGVLFGATGGYIVGFIACALVMWLITSRFGNGTKSLAFAMALGLVACYTLGTVWFMTIYLRSNDTITLLSVLTKCVFPFILPDTIKIILALILIKRLRPLIHLFTDTEKY